MSSSYRGGVFNERSFKNVPNDYLQKVVHQHPKMSKMVDFGCWRTCFGLAGERGLGNHCIECNEFSEPLRACLPMAFGFFVKRFKN